MKPKYFFLGLFVLSFTHVHGQLRAVKEWSAVYDGPAHGVDLPLASILDKNRNFYITGRSVGDSSGMDIATIKYSPSGQQTLTLRYNSPANSWDEGNSLAVDDSGNIYVAGTSAVTSSGWEIVLLKYSPTGSICWESHFRPDTANSATASKIVLDTLGNIYLGGTCKSQMLLLKYNRAGLLLDSAMIGDDSTMHAVSDLLITRSGSICLAGSRSYILPGNDVPTVECAVVSVDTEGRLLWKEYLKAESARSVCLDRQGNIVVIAGGNGTTAKYSPDGHLRWNRDHQNSSPWIEILTGLAIDNRNRIIVGGYGCVVGCFDYMTLWYDADGNIVHYQSYNSPDTLRDFCMALTLDKSDNVYLTGMSAAGYSDGTCLTLKYDSSAIKIWEKTYSSSPSAIDEGEFIAVDDSGYVYVGGSSVTLNGWDYLAIKYSQVVGVEVRDETVGSNPSIFSLSQNYPNPFNPITNITFQVPITSHVTLSVYDMLGREVAVLVNERREAGVHEVKFDGSGLSSGVYFYRLTAGTFVETRRLLLLR